MNGIDCAFTQMKLRILGLIRIMINSVYDSK